MSYKITNKMDKETPEIFKTTYNKAHNWKIAEKPKTYYPHYNENVLQKDEDIWYVEERLDKEGEEVGYQTNIRK